MSMISKFGTEFWTSLLARIFIVGEGLPWPISTTRLESLGIVMFVLRELLKNEILIAGVVKLCIVEFDVEQDQGH
jgi:hypothetical protein